MMRIFLSWLKVEKKQLFVLLLLSFCLSFGAVFVQEQSARRWQEEQPQQIESWYNSTQMEMHKGEVSDWNNYIGSMLSDLGMLRVLWKNPEQNQELIVETQNAFYRKVIQDPGFCQRALELDSSELEQRIALAQSYEQRGWKQPFNPFRARAEYMVYTMDHYFSIILLIVLSGCCLIGVWIWARMYESGSVRLMLALPYKKGQLFTAFLILNLGIPFLFLAAVCGFLWLAGLSLCGNDPLLIVENGQILPCSQAALQNLSYVVILCLMVLCMSMAVSVFVRLVSDSLIILTVMMMALYFLLRTVHFFCQLPWLAWTIVFACIVVSTVLSRRKFGFEN